MIWMCFPLMQQDGGQDGGTHPRNTHTHTRACNGAAVWMDGAVESSGFAYVKNKAQ